MCNLSRRGLQAVTLAMALSVPGAAWADPVTLTGGYVEVQIPSGLARGQFHGNDFSVSFGADGFRTSLQLGCYPCLAGTTVNLDGFFNLPRVGARGTVDGVTYAQLYLDGMTGRFTTSAFEVTGIETFEVTLPFSYAGQVTGYVTDPWLTGTPEEAFTKQLVGHGVARATFFSASGVFTPIDLRYDFGDPAPVPEPATMILFGAGSAVLALRRRQMRRRARHTADVA